MSALVTPDLVRMYLRATGWTVLDASAGSWQLRGYVVHAQTTMDDHELAYQINTLAAVERVAWTVISARLGMLAAAERLEAALARMPAPKDRTDYGRGSADALKAELRGILKLVGVDPSAWEKTRST